MDQTPLVEARIRDGERLLKALAGANFDVTTAFWLYSDETGEWRLYFASPSVDAEGSRKAYSAIRSVLERMPAGFSISSLDIWAVGVNEPIVRALESYLAKFPAPLATRLRRTPIGDYFFEDAYVYPAPGIARQPQISA